MGNRGHNRLPLQYFIVSFAPQPGSKNFEVLVLLLQQILRLASLRYIAGHFCKAHERPAAIVDRADHNTCPKLTSVFANAPSFSLKLAVSRRLTKGFCWKLRLSIEICVKAREMLADYFVAGVALYTFGTAVPGYDATRLIQHINRVILDVLNQYRKLR